MGHEVTTHTYSGENFEDYLVQLRSDSGSSVWISSRAASIEDLFLRNEAGVCRRLVYGHNDHLLDGDRNKPFEYSRSAHESMCASRNENLMAGGVPVTFFPGRLYGGQMRFLQDDGSYRSFAVPNSHPKFGSLLHLGDGKNNDFGIAKRNEGDEASVTFICPEIGVLLYEQGFPRGIHATVKYTLKNDVLTRDVAITNNSNITLGVPLSDHGSYLPGVGNATDLSVVLHTSKELELAPDTLVATGFYQGDEPDFNDGREVKIQDPREHMYSNNKTSFTIMNRKEGIGLRIEADPRTLVSYFWVPKSRNFVSIQPYNGPLTAALSLPAFRDIRGVETLFGQPRSLMHARKETKTYRQRFRAIAVNSGV